MDKGKQRAESAQDFDVMDEAEIRQIIDRSGIIEDGSGGLGDGVRFVKPSELDQRQSTSGSRPSSSSNSSLRAAAVNGRNRPRKLVELIDGDETGEAIEYEEDEQGPEISEFGEEMFRMTLYMIVFGTLWLCMDMMIHAQYGQDVNVKTELGRSIDVLPGLAFVIYLTSHYPASRLTKLALFAFSAIGGSHMVYLVNRESYLKVVRRCPALGTLWIWSIVQLDLMAAVSSLLCVFAYVKYRGLNVIFAS